MKSQYVTTVRRQLETEEDTRDATYKTLPSPSGDNPSPLEIRRETISKWCKLMSKTDLIEELQSWEWKSLICFLFLP